MPPVIRIENISKSYLIAHGQQRSGYRTLRESIANLAAAPLRRLRGRGNGRMEEFWALTDVNLEVQQGEVLGIIGRNGAGKSTLLKILSRITAPTTGRVELRGRVGSLLEVGTGFHPELTGRENIFLNGSILGMSRREILWKFDEIVDFSGVEKFLDTPVKRYSSGMYVRLAFAVAAHLEPEILIVDEVLAVGDVEFQKKCLGKMEDVVAQGRTVLFVSHNITAIKRICTSTVLLSNGKMIAMGKTPEIVDLYLAAGAGDAKSLPKLLDDCPFTSINLSINKREITDCLPVQTDAPLQVTVTLKAASPVPCPVVDIALYRNDGLKLFGIKSDAISNEERRQSSKEWQLCFTINLSQLMSQHVYLDLGVRNRFDTHYYLTWYRATSLELYNRLRDNIFTPDSLMRPIVDITPSNVIISE